MEERLWKNLLPTQSKLCPEKQPGLDIFRNYGDSGKNLGEGLQEAKDFLETA